MFKACSPILILPVYGSNLLNYMLLQGLMPLETLGQLGEVLVPVYLQQSPNQQGQSCPRRDTTHADAHVQLRFLSLDLLSWREVPALNNVSFRHMKFAQTPKLGNIAF
jgi:hypothetical protein